MMNNVIRTVIGTVIVLAVSCSHAGSSPVIRAQSQVLLTQPPDKAIAGSYQASETTNWNYFARSDKNEILLTDKVGNGEEILTVPGTGVLAVLKREIDDTTYLLVSTVDASGRFVLVRYHDSDGDGAPDSGTELQLLDSGSNEMYVTQLTAEDGPDFYLLDARCQDVLRADDTDGDGWPDTLETVPFAMSDDHSDLKSVEQLFKGNEPGVLNAIMGKRTPGNPVERELRVVLTDANGDGVADTVVLTEPMITVPVILGTPYDGQTEVLVIGETGRTVEFYRLDPSGDPTVLLGSWTFVSGLAETATLTSPLANTEEIQIRFTNVGAPTVFAKVVEKSPQVIEVTPQIWRYDEGATIQLFGQNFSTNMTVKLVTAGNNTYTASYSFIDSSNITVTVPALTLEEDIGSATIAACDPGQTAPGFPGGCALCESATVSHGGE